MKTACVLVDDVNNPQSGWAAYAGEKANYVEDMIDLANDAVWVTNLNWHDLDIYGLSNHARFRPQDYFGLKLSRAIEEVIPPSVKNARASEIMANLFERQVKLIQALVFKDIREYWQPHPYSLAKAIREEALPKDPDLRKDQLLVGALTHSKQEFTRCSVRMPENTMYVPLVIPRVNHALNVAKKTIIPFSDEYEKVKGKYPTNEDAQQQWLADAGGPMLIEAIITDYEPEFASLFNYGGRVTAKKVRKTGGRTRSIAPTRTWVTSHDLMVLAGFAKVEVKQAIVFKNAGYLADVPVMSEFIKQVEAGPTALKAGWSMGVLAQNLWRGISLENPPTVAAQREELISENILAPFIRSVDRGLCLEHAIRLKLEGYTVMGYGTGSVFVALEDGDDIRARALEAAYKSGTLSYMTDAADPFARAFMENVTFDESHDPVWKNVFTVLGSGGWEELQMFDEKTVDVVLERLGGGK